MYATFRSSLSTTAVAVLAAGTLAAAPVQVSRTHLASTGGVARALLVNSGCANAATGDEEAPAAKPRRTRRTLAARNPGVEAAE